MKPWLHKLESFVDRAIPYALIVLTAIIIIEIFFKEFAEKYHLWIVILDYTIIAFFMVDLIFKYQRIRKFKKFIKECWLDIIAVFPFVLFFRVFETVSLFVRLPAEFKEGQSILHTIVEGKKEFTEFFGKGSKLIEDAKLAGEFSRTEKILKAVRPLARAPRLIKALPFYEKPTGKHHLHEMEELEEAEKGIKKEEKRLEKGINKFKKRLGKFCGKNRPQPDEALQKPLPAKLEKQAKKRKKKR
ncbi:MAG: ion transporter [Nanoarchaeota archaeon]|nr:ion transporter [Nanoarchaeota archaeon]